MIAPGVRSNRADPRAAGRRWRPTVGLIIMMMRADLSEEVAASSALAPLLGRQRSPNRYLCLILSREYRQPLLPVVNSSVPALFHAALPPVPAFLAFKTCPCPAYIGCHILHFTPPTLKGALAQAHPSAQRLIDVVNTLNRKLHTIYAVLFSLADYDLCAGRQYAGCKQSTQ